MPETPTIPRDWMSPQDLADWLHVPVKSVYVWRQTGRGPRGTRVGKHVRYSRRAVADWLAQQDNEGAA
jgi:hypothetical protein